MDPLSPPPHAGGSRGLDRHSTDLDFDSPAPIALEKRVQQGFRNVGVPLLQIHLGKDSGTTQRCVGHYRRPESKTRECLKTETKIRKDIDPATIEEVKGFRILYAYPQLQQKITAFQNRVIVRDLYDLEFLTRTHADQLTDTQVQTMWRKTDNPDAVEQKFRTRSAVR